ncbi:hypothetical protein [Streptomyces sp. NPDC047024]|uniref:hypothetical protein n=1 Tax=Streptomyces sp. NPDC047024 TaxID=3155476 RepID=UPI0033D544AF
MNALLWAQSHAIPAVLASTLAVVVALLLARVGRQVAGRIPAAVLVASLGAIACTAYSGDTSWRFAEHRLGMTSPGERSALFLAAELGLFACALMARQNLRERGAPGTPGVLVWFITGVQVIPAYSESGFVGGTVRAVVGPVMAALLWHLAMGIELRHREPGALTNSLPALLARELRERLLSRLGLATRDRSAEQITRDRWTVKAVGLAAKLADMGPEQRGRNRVARRLSVAVGRAQAGASEEQRAKLLDLLAARRHAASLATIDLASPWETAPEVTVEQVIEETPALPPARPPVVPAGVHLLPLVARPARPEVTTPPEPPRYRWDNILGRLVDVDPVQQPVTKQLYRLDTFKEQWVPAPPSKPTAAVPAEQAREVVTQTITITPSELRRKARSLNREAVRSTGKPVTIKGLQDELGLSRREATDLRREVVMSGLVTGEQS